MRYSVLGAGSWTELTGTTAVSRTIPAGTLTAGQTYEVQVCTKGDHASFGAWSASTLVQALAAPAVTITAPTGPTLASSRLTATWAYLDPQGAPQAAWLATLLDDSSTIIEQHAGTGPTSTVDFAAALADATEYTVTVAVESGYGLWSSVASVTVTTALVYPPAPTLDLIYHPDTSRIGEQVLGNSAVRAVVAGAEGSQRLINLKGIDMLAGYSPLKTTGWGIITQTPTANPLAALNGLMLQTLKYTIPLLLLTLLAVWWLSRRIAQPLWHLANIVKNWSAPYALEKLGEVRAHYFEAEQLKQSIIEGLMLIQQQLGKLSRESLTDPLTGLDNRRGLRLAIDNLQSRQRPFSVITLDIDHFKQVNDQFGHDLGDQVLLHLAAQMRACTRNDVLLCRSGGEEFVILLPDMDLDSASALGERLRERMANSPSPIGTPVTISLGVAYASAGKHSPAQVLKLADQALYQAKKQGRNRLVAAQLAEFF